MQGSHTNVFFGFLGFYCVFMIPRSGYNPYRVKKYIITLFFPIGFLVFFIVLKKNAKNIWCIRKKVVILQAQKRKGRLAE